MHLQTMVSWEDVVKVASKLMLKHGNESHFTANGQKEIYTHKSLLGC